MSSTTGDRQTSQALLRRRLGSELRQHRKKAQLTIKQVAIHLSYSASTVSRIENGHINATVSVVRDMLNYYGIRGHESETIEQLAHKALLARQGRQKEAWWHEYKDPDLRTYVGFERAVESIRQYETIFIPGLLQIAAYARIIITAHLPTLSPQEVERHVQLRMARQQLLLGDDRPKFIVVLDEAALHRLSGINQLYQDQLNHLIEMAKMPNIAFQVLPFEAALHGGMISEFTILRFHDSEDPDIVHLEYPSGGLYLHREDQIKRYRLAFERLRTVAHTPKESIDFITGLANGR